MSDKVKVYPENAFTQHANTIPGPQQFSKEERELLEVKFLKK